MLWYDLERTTSYLGQFLKNYIKAMSKFGWTVLVTPFKFTPVCDGIYVVQWPLMGAVAFNLEASMVGAIMRMHVFLHTCYNSRPIILQLLVKLTSSFTFLPIVKENQLKIIC